MRTRRLLATALAAWIASSAAWADDHHRHWARVHDGHGHYSHFRVFIGAPFVFLPPPQ